MIRDDESTTNETCFKYYTCRSVFHYEIRVIIGNEEICENCIEIYEIIAELKNEHNNINYI